jgi:hypothetical protein
MEELRKSSREACATAAKPVATLQAFACRNLDEIYAVRVARMQSVPNNETRLLDVRTVASTYR